MNSQTFPPPIFAKKDKASTTTIQFNNSPESWFVVPVTWQNQNSYLLCSGLFTLVTHLYHGFVVVYSL